MGQSWLDDDEHHWMHKQGVRHIHDDPKWSKRDKAVGCGIVLIAMGISLALVVWIVAVILIP